MSVLAFTVQGAPVPCARPRVFRNPRTGAIHGVTEPRTAAYEQRVALCARVAARAARWSPPPGSAYEFRLDVYRLVRRGDFDNLAKSVADALTKARVWADDRYVEIATIRLLVDRECPRIEVQVRAIPPSSADVDPGRAFGGAGGSRGAQVAKTRPRVTQTRSRVSSKGGR